MKEEKCLIPYSLREKNDIKLFLILDGWGFSHFSNYSPLKAQGDNQDILQSASSGATMFL